jgi:hypothetical protein
LNSVIKESRNKKISAGNQQPSDLVYLTVAEGQIINL